MAHNLMDVKGKTSSLTNEDIFASSQYVSTSHPPNQPWPGILTVRISHGNGFSIPDQYHQAVNSLQSGSSLTQAEISKRPWLNLNGRRLLLLYAIVEYGKFSARSLSASETIENLRWENLGSYSVKFNVFRAAELVLRFYLCYPGHGQGSSDFFLGKARIEPALEEKKYTKWLQVEEGAGEICVEIEYTKTATPGIQAVGGRQGPSLRGRCSPNPCYHFQVEKQDTNLLYASKKLVNVDASHVFLSQADKPFIAPLDFVATIPEGLQLYAPLIHGGPLFYHLQKPRRFDVDRCRFYAAEILCAFESLLQSNPSYCGPKTENILLDSIGHIVLCDFSLYHLDMEQPAHSTVEYPAPEQLLHGNSSVKTYIRWWWTLGIFLYEMLTGIPPFFAESIEKIHERITSSEHIVYPNSLPSSAKDILAGLLERNPEQRLGAKRGASEIKQHPFFDCIDWNKLTRREYHPDFKP
ncbi:hypothetical protein CI102_3769, partial [Trichoderma harzianum]